MPLATGQQGNSGDRGGQAAARVSPGCRGAPQGPRVAPAWTWRAGWSLPPLGKGGPTSGSDS